MQTGKLQLFIHLVPQEGKEPSIAQCPVFAVVEGYLIILISGWYTVKHLKKMHGIWKGQNSNFRLYKRGVVEGIRTNNINKHKKVLSSFQENS